MKTRFQLIILLMLALASCTDSTNRPDTNTANNNQPQRYIIQCNSECAVVEKQIVRSGGTIQQRYQNFDILTFDLTIQNVNPQEFLSGFRVVKDKIIKSPSPVEKYSVSGSSHPLLSTTTREVPTTGISLQNYAGTNDLNGASEAHEHNIYGKGIIVAIIDSGTANNPDIVPLLANNVIGGENFIIEADEPSATSTLNDDHGTWVGTMIAAHGAIVTSVDDPIAVALSTHSPKSVIPIANGMVEIPVMGMAPAASLYALKTFSASGGGTSSSIIIAAMDRALTLKTNFNNGMPSEPVAGDGSEDSPYVYDSLNIQVVNLSLGGPSLFPGAELDDLITDALLEAGVVVVVSAGNEGFAAITGGSPGTGVGAIAVGAGNDFIHERVLRDVTIEQGVGIEFRPTTHPQIAAFSSRGPTADGRDGIDIVANGRGVFAQGANGNMRLVSGTSFSAPTVAGAAALLRQAFPDKPAYLIKAALVEGANKTFFGLTTGKYDQGHGYLDVEEAMELLEHGLATSHLPTEPKAEIGTRVIDNIQALGIDVFTLQETIFSAEYDLIPGQVKQIYVETDKDTHDIVIEIEEFETQLPPPLQNQIFGDEVILSVVDAPLSFDHVVLQELILAPQTFTISHPQPGLSRVAILGDWTNAGNVSIEINVTRLSEPAPIGTIIETLNDGEMHIYKFDIAPGMAFLNLQLSWTQDWSMYPSHDIDMFLFDPLGDFFSDVSGATLHSPEIAQIENPTPGTWQVHVDGFLMHQFSDQYTLLVADQDGNILTGNRVQ